MRFKWVSLASVASMLLSCFSASAAVINVGSHQLIPDSAIDQTIQIFVTGGDLVQGLNFYAQIADGGPGAGGSVNAPTITSADILTGTIFGPNNTGAQDPGSVPQLIARTTTTATETVSASGLLVTLKVKTLGFTNGEWALNLGNTLNGPTDFAGLPITITDGFISVPEPSMLLSAIFGAAGCMLSRRKRSR